MIGGASRAVIAKQQKEIRHQIDLHHRKEARDKLAALRLAIRTGKVRIREALRGAVEFCRQERLRVRAAAKLRREHAQAELRRLREEEIAAARSTCALRKHETRQEALSRHAKARQELRHERAYQAELRRIEGRHRERSQRHNAKEKRQESDDEVLSDIPRELEPLWSRVKRHIRGSDRKSRSEAFFEYAEEHPDEVLQAQMDLAEEEMGKLVRAERKLAKTVHRRAPPTAAELAAIPF